MTYRFLHGLSVLAFVMAPYILGYGLLQAVSDQGDQHAILGVAIVAALWGLVGLVAKASSSVMREQEHEIDALQRQIDRLDARLAEMEGVPPDDRPINTRVKAAPELHVAGPTDAVTRPETLPRPLKRLPPA